IERTEHDGREKPSRGNKSDHEAPPLRRDGDYYGEPCDHGVSGEVQRAINVNEHTGPALQRLDRIRSQRRKDQRVQEVRRDKHSERARSRNVLVVPPGEHDSRERGEHLCGKRDVQHGQGGSSNASDASTWARGAASKSPSESSS